MGKVAPVTVICVTYNSGSVLPGILSSLRDGMAGTSWDLIVVDNNSDDGSVGTVRSLAPYATVIEAPHNRGFAAGVNRGLQRTSAERAVLLVNPDTRLHEGSVARLVAELRNPSVGIVAPRLLEEDGSTFPSLRREPSLLRALGAAFLGERRAGRVPFLGEVIVGTRAYRRARDVAWAGGAVLLLAPGLTERIGLLDESFFLYSEEADLALRARDAGFRVRYQPEAVATHIGGESTTSPELYRLLMANKLRLYARRHPGWRARLYRRLLLLHQRLRAFRDGMSRHGVDALCDRSLLDG